MHEFNLIDKIFSGMGGKHAGMWCIIKIEGFSALLVLGKLVARVELAAVAPNPSMTLLFMNSLRFILFFKGS